MVQQKGLLAVPGMQAMGVHCGLKKDRLDLAILYSPGPETAVAAVFTQNAFAAAPVHVSRQHIAQGRVKAVVVNSGSANACTGRKGLRDALAMAKETAGALGIEPEEVMVCSTGRIGLPLPMEKIGAGIHDCAGRLAEASGLEAGLAILTTDSGPKESTHTFTVDGHPLTVSGIAKGAGMIHPNMATMLAFIATDTQVAQKDLQDALRWAADRSFNQISVDGDESTNDTAAVIATGSSGVTLTPQHADWPLFQNALLGVCQDLAKQIAADGEGATRLVHVTVSGAKDDAEAREAARAVAKSNLVKCAIHGADPNWGRIVSSLGQSRVAVDPAKVDIHLGNGPVLVQVLAAGEPVDALAEANMALQAPEVEIHIHLNLGGGRGEAWGCDMTPDYVSFNAHYTT